MALRMREATTASMLGDGSASSWAANSGAHGGVGGGGARDEFEQRRARERMVRGGRRVVEDARALVWAGGDSSLMTVTH